MNITRRVRIFFSLLTVLGLNGCASTAPDNYTEHPGNEGDGSFTVGPEYKLDPDLTDRGNPKGKYFEFLQASSYHHRFVFSLGTGHCDRRVFEQTLADTLVWVWRGYHPD